MRAGRQDVSAFDRLGPLEVRVVELVWNRPGPVSVRDLQADLPELAYTTVMTTLDRLYKKGVLERRKEGRAFVYSARVTPHELQHTLSQRLARWLLGADRTSARPLLSGLVDSLSETDGELLDELDRIVRARREQLKRGRR